MADEDYTMGEFWREWKPELKERRRKARNSAYERIKVVEEDVWEQVMSALERPLAPTESMSNAFKRYNSEESWSCN